MHGWVFIGSRHAPRGQRIFWFSILSTFLVLAGYLMKQNISAYTNSVTTIKTVDRTANLSDAFFPSIVICNINQLRKSFIYWLHDNIHQNIRLNDQSPPSIVDVFSLVKNHYFRVENEISENHEDLLERILESKFFEEKFEQFYKRNLDALKSLVPVDDKLEYYSNVMDKAELIGVLSESTKKAYHKSYLQAMASQWTIGQMIIMMRWKGKGGIFYQPDYSTDYGVCNWVSPSYQQSNGSDGFFNKLQRGALNEKNNGLSFLLDAETYDYGDGSSTGEGFKIAIVHPMDIGIMESMAINVDIGMVTNIGVSTTLTNITGDAVTSFNPYERKCWMQSEIDLMHYQREMDYRYKCMFIHL